MKKRLIAVLLALVMLVSVTVTAGAAGYTTEQERAADALNHLGLFLGDGTGYALEEELNRAQGVILLVRMLGKEAEAYAGGDHGMPFTDTTTTRWADSHIGYAWKNNITKGTSDTEFEPRTAMKDYTFLTLVLRALGYSDLGEDPQFDWRNPYDLAKEIGLIDSTTPDADEFTRGEAVEIFWNAMGAKLYNSGDTLADRLILQGVITNAQYTAAKNIRVNGKPVTPSVPVNPGTGETNPGTGETNPGTGETNPGTGETNPGTGETDPGTGSTNPDPGTSDKPLTEYTYEEYMAMSGAEQMAFMEQFVQSYDNELEGMQAYFEWLNAAKEAYEAAHPDIEIGDDGTVDLGGQP